jgi:hypothetical protein
MPRRAMGRGRAVTAFATASVAGHTGVSGESDIFAINISRVGIGRRSARPPIGTYAILREDTR